MSKLKTFSSKVKLYVAFGEYYSENIKALIEAYVCRERLGGRPRMAFITGNDTIPVVVWSVYLK